MVRLKRGRWGCKDEVHSCDTGSWTWTHPSLLLGYSSCRQVAIWESGPFWKSSTSGLNVQGHMGVLEMRNPFIP